MIMLLSILLDAPPALRPTYHPVQEYAIGRATGKSAANAEPAANKADVDSAVDANKWLTRMCAIPPLVYAKSGHGTGGAGTPASVVELFPP